MKQTQHNYKNQYSTTEIDSKQQKQKNKKQTNKKQ